jgi:GNAT superfamily N-acetyltransferase
LLNDSLFLKGEHWVALKPDSQLVGCIGIDPADDGQWWLKNFSVSKQVRGQGIGQMLIKAALQRADQLNITLRLCTLENHGRKQNVMGIA